MTASNSTPPRRGGGRLQALLAEYGPLALGVYFAIFLIVLVGFVVGITLGLEVDGAAGTAGTWGAAYIATKLTQPLRIAATLALTPLVVRIQRRLKPQPVAEESSAASE